MDSRLDSESYDDDDDEEKSDLRGATDASVEPAIVTTFIHSMVHKQMDPSSEVDTK